MKHMFVFYLLNHISEKSDEPLSTDDGRYYTYYFKTAFDIWIYTNSY